MKFFRLEIKRIHDEEIDGGRGFAIISLKNDEIAFMVMIWRWVFGVIRR